MTQQTVIQRNIRTDRKVSIYLYAIMSFSLSLLILSVVCGTDSLYYYSMPSLICLSFAAVFLFGTSRITEGMMNFRLSRNNYTGALRVYRNSKWICIGISLVCAVITGLFADIIAEYLLSERLCSLVLYALCLCLLLCGPIGCMQGFLNSCRREDLTRFSMRIFCIVYLVLSVVLGKVFASFGTRIGRLLRNDSMESVYAAAGVMTAMAISLLVLLVMTQLSVNRVRKANNHPEDYNYPHINEKAGMMRREFLRQVSAACGTVFPVFFSVYFDYRIYCHFAEHTEGSGVNVVYEWGAFAGLALAICVLIAMYQCVPMTNMPRALNADYKNGRRKILRRRFTMVMRLISFMAMPFILFLCSCARPVIYIFLSGEPNQKISAAVHTLRYTSVLILLLNILLLMILLLSRIDRMRVVRISLFFGLLLQCILCVLLSSPELMGIHAVPLCLDIACAVAVVLMYLYARGGILHSVDRSFITPFMFTFLYAAIAAIPCYLLEDILLRHLGGIGATILEALLYSVIYIALSVLTGLVDERDITRIPGGVWLARLSEQFR